MKRILPILILTPLSALGQIAVEETTPPPPPPPPQPSPTFKVELGASESALAHSVVAPLVSPANGWFPVRTVSVHILHDSEGKPSGAQAVIVADIAPADLAKVRAAIAPLWGMPEAVASRPITSVAATVATNGVAQVTLTFK